LTAFFGKGKDIIELNSVSKLPGDKFTHITLTVGELGDVSLYINGKSEASEEVGIVRNAHLDHSSFFIGQPPSYVSETRSFGMSGLVANMDLYYKPLEPNKVNEIYDGITIITTTSNLLINYFRLSENFE